MKDIVRYEFGIEAIEFVISRLQRGLSLSQRILKEIDLRTGRCFAHMPERVSHLHFFDFDDGLLLPTDPSTYEHDHLEMYESFSEYDDGILIFENHFIDAHRVGEIYPVPTIFYEDEVYDFLLPGIQLKDIDRTLRFTARYPTIGIATRSSKRIKERLRLDSTDLDELANNVEKLFIGAFDEEGYLIWVPKA